MTCTFFFSCGSRIYQCHTNSVSKGLSRFWWCDVFRCSRLADVFVAETDRASSCGVWLTEVNRGYCTARNPYVYTASLQKRCAHTCLAVLSSSVANEGKATGCDDHSYHTQHQPERETCQQDDQQCQPERETCQQDHQQYQPERETCQQDDANDSICCCFSSSFFLFISWQSHMVHLKEIRQELTEKTKTKQNKNRESKRSEDSPVSVCSQPYIA